MDGASVAVFRMCIGFLVPLEILHYLLFRPFLTELYFNPGFHFKYPFFEWVPDLSAVGIQVLLVVICVSFAMVGLGLFYKIARWISFLGFSWLFLMERASFLNHWYMICLFSFLLLFIPANGLWSLDAKRNPKLRSDQIKGWHLYILIALMSLVYFYSGFVKINGDWLQGLQMKQYLLNSFGEGPAGLSYLASWGVLVLELAMVPLLLWKRTRIPIFILTVLFHLVNTQLFTVGLFPFMMIGFTLLYFAPDWPRKLLAKIGKQPKTQPKKKGKSTTKSGPENPPWMRQVTIILLTVFFGLQLFLPLRSLLYKGNTLWTEEGFICAWKMMLDAKTSSTENTIIYSVKPEPGASSLLIVPQKEELTWAQENKLIRNPDLILQYAHHLGNKYRSSDSVEPEVYVDTYLGLNGRPVQRYIHPNVDLFAESRRYLKPYPWVLPLKVSTPIPPLP